MPLDRQPVAWLQPQQQSSGQALRQAAHPRDHCKTVWWRFSDPPALTSLGGCRPWHSELVVRCCWSPGGTWWWHLSINLSCGLLGGPVELVRASAAGVDVAEIPHNRPPECTRLLPRAARILPRCPIVPQWVRFPTIHPDRRAIEPAARACLDCWQLVCPSTTAIGKPSASHPAIRPSADLLYERDSAGCKRKACLSQDRKARFTWTREFSWLASLPVDKMHDALGAAR